MDEERLEKVVNKAHSIAQYLNNFGRNANTIGKMIKVEIEITSCFSCPHFMYEYN